MFQNKLNALHLAAKEGHIDIVIELLRRKIDVNAVTKVVRHYFPRQLSLYYRIKLLLMPL